MCCRKIRLSILHDWPHSCQIYRYYQQGAHTGAGRRDILCWREGPCSTTRQRMRLLPRERLISLLDEEWEARSTVLVLIGLRMLKQLLASVWQLNQEPITCMVQTKMMFGKSRDWEIWYRDWGTSEKLPISIPPPSLSSFSLIAKWFGGF